MPTTMSYWRSRPWVFSLCWRVFTHVPSGEEPDLPHCHGDFLPEVGVGLVSLMSFTRIGVRSVPLLVKWCTVLMDRYFSTPEPNGFSNRVLVVVVVVVVVLFLFFGK